MANSASGKLQARAFHSFKISILIFCIISIHSFNKKYYSVMQICFIFLTKICKIWQQENYFFYEQTTVCAVNGTMGALLLLWSYINRGPSLLMEGGVCKEIISPLLGVEGWQKSGHIWWGWLEGGGSYQKQYITITEIFGLSAILLKLTKYLYLPQQKFNQHLLQIK